MISPELSNDNMRDSTHSVMCICTHKDSEDFVFGKLCGSGRLNESNAMHCEVGSPVISNIVDDIIGCNE